MGNPHGEAYTASPKALLLSSEICIYYCWSFRCNNTGNNIGCSLRLEQLIRPGSLEQERTDNGCLTGTWEPLWFPRNVPEQTG